MNCIKLTNIQKLNLLVMCNKLFPEYNNIRFGTSVMTTSKDYLYFHKIKNEMQLEIINIHWFEFCINYLLQKVNKSYYTYTRYQNEEGETHIVDYLYEEFLKLKL